MYGGFGRCNHGSETGAFAAASLLHSLPLALPSLSIFSSTSSVLVAKRNKGSRCASRARTCSADPVCGSKAARRAKSTDLSLFWLKVCSDALRGKLWSAARCRESSGVRCTGAVRVGGGEVEWV